jgi:starch synthase
LSSSAPVSSQPVVALFPWGLLLEDFLEPDRLTLEEFCGDFIGSWMFGCAEALRCAGVDTVIVSLSAQVTSVTRVRHAATGTPISLLPAARTFRALRSRMSRPYGRSTAEVFPFAARHRVARPGLFAAKELAPYLATPLGPFLRELRHRSCTAILCQEYEFPRFDFCVATRRLHRLPVFGIFQGGDSYGRCVRRTDRFLRGGTGAPCRYVSRRQRRIDSELDRSLSLAPARPF